MRVKLTIGVSGIDGSDTERTGESAVVEVPDGLTDGKSITRAVYLVYLPPRSNDFPHVRVHPRP